MRLLWARTGSCVYCFQLYYTGHLLARKYGKHSLAISPVKIERLASLCNSIHIYLLYDC